MDAKTFQRDPAIATNRVLEFGEGAPVRAAGQSLRG